MSTETKSTQVSSNRVRAGKRTYFFDVKSGPKGGLYLSISETAVQEEGVFSRNRMLVLETHARDFYEGLCEAIRSLREEQKKREEVEAPAAVKPVKKAKAA